MADGDYERRGGREAELKRFQRLLRARRAARRGVPCYLATMSCACALGSSPEEILRRLRARSAAGLKAYADDIPGRTVLFGEVAADLPAIADEEYDTRTNRLLLHVLNARRDAFEALVARYGRDRVAIVLGTSNTGIDEAQRHVDQWIDSGRKPDAMRFSEIELGTPAEFLAKELGVTGPVYAISTACSSSAKVFPAARRLIEAGVVDAAIVGGADGRCRFALNGFHALGALAQDRCRPLAADRDGINLGEGAALFTCEKGARAPVGGICFTGAGETSDAYHATAPDPDGRGAEAAMRAALVDAGLAANEVGYVNLHGTGTPANDAMEMKAFARLFAATTPHESTKDLTGHCLGAAGAVEAALCWLKLHAGDVRGAALSNSFAFGGSNASVVFERVEDRSA